MIAFVFTGNPRTFHKTHRLIFDNLIAGNQGAHVFVVCECEAPASFEKELAGAWGNRGVPIHLRIVESTRTPAFVDLVEYHLKHKRAFTRLGSFPPDFFRESGCILEYYQFMLAYDLMIDYERNSGLRFENVVRSRFDVVLTEPLRMTTPSLAPLPLPRAIAERLHLPAARLFEYPPLAQEGEHAPGPTMITMYCNWIWIATRPVMDLMHRFVYCFGDYEGDMRDCFNSENQFMLHLQRHGVRIQTYFSEKEWRLWTGHEKDGLQLIDESGRWIHEDPDILVAIVRH